MTGTTSVLGTTNINISGANNTNIGTGTNAGTIAIGNISTGDLSLNDAQWNITGLGAANFNSLSINGGYAATGATISNNGNIQTKGALTVDSTINTNTLTSTGLTFSGVNPIISVSTTNTGLAVEQNGTGTLTLEQPTETILLTVLTLPLILRNHYSQNINQIPLTD